jgi:hypothetical protein
MATTTNYSWTTPDDTDLVKDGASAIRTLGSAIDTTVFTNAGAAVAKATVDAKGDLLVGTADNTVDRLAVGTDGFTLVADSSTATGLAYAAPAAGGGMTLLNAGGTTLTGASVTLSSISQAYINLFVIIRNFRPATDDRSLKVRFNGVTTNSYNNTLSYSATTDVSFGDDAIGISAAADNTATTSLGHILIPDYTNTTTFKNCTGYHMTMNPTTNTNINNAFVAGYHNKTEAIESITFLASGGNLTAGTVFLYGVK